MPSCIAGVNNELKVLQRGNRLEITADVDLEGLEQLKAILGKYEEILKMLESLSPKKTEEEKARDIFK